ncbi:MAG TPA: serine/threonine-protein kinase [Ktedonobacteraceae bacterium]
MNEDDRTGQRLDKYRLVRLLGRSACSEVYLGEHLHSKFPVAIKMLSGHFTRNEMKKFLVHGSTLAQLKHPHIVQVIESGLNDTVPFLVMDFAPNGNLRERHPKGTRVPLETVVSYVQQIAGALDYVHDHKLIHRDIKPHNMLLGPDNEVLLSDFGIAIPTYSVDAIRSNDFEGTIVYAAPEQLEGEPRRSSDQYALGVVVYEWLCGEWPFCGSFTEVAHQHLFVSPPGLHEKNSAISLAVEKVVLKALAKDPVQRFANVKEFADALEQASWADKQPIALSELSPLPTLTKRQFMSPFPFEPVATD